MIKSVNAIYTILVNYLTMFTFSVHLILIYLFSCLQYTRTNHKNRITTHKNIKGSFGCSGNIQREKVYLWL